MGGSVACIFKGTRAQGYIGDDINMAVELVNGRGPNRQYTDHLTCFCKNASSESNIVNTTSVPSLPYFILVV